MTLAAARVMVARAPASVTACPPRNGSLPKRSACCVDPSVTPLSTAHAHCPCLLTAATYLPQLWEALPTTPDCPQPLWGGGLGAVCFVWRGSRAPRVSRGPPGERVSSTQSATVACEHTAEFSKPPAGGLPGRGVPCGDRRGPLHARTRARSDQPDNLGTNETPHRKCMGRGRAHQRVSRGGGEER